MVSVDPPAALGELLAVELLAVPELVLLELLPELPHPVSAATTAMTASRTQPVTGILNFIVPPRSVVGLGCESASEPARRYADRTPSPVGVIVLLGDHPVADGAKALDRDLDDVAGEQPNRRLPGKAHAAGRSGGDDVAREQAGERGEELDRARHVHDHLRGACRLHYLAVEHRGQCRVGHVGLVG